MHFLRKKNSSSVGVSSSASSSKSTSKTNLSATTSAAPKILDQIAEQNGQIVIDVHMDDNNSNKLSNNNSNNNTNDSDNDLNALTDVLVVTNDMPKLTPNKRPKLPPPPPPSLLPLNTANVPSQSPIATARTTTINAATADVISQIEANERRKSMELPMAKTELDEALPDLGAGNEANSIEAASSKAVASANANANADFDVIVVTSACSIGEPIAPIACAEDAEMCDCIAESDEIERDGNDVGGLSAPVNAAVNTPVIQRSKSRMRTYLKKCRDRLANHLLHHDMQPAIKSNNSNDSWSTNAAANHLNAGADLVVMAQASPLPTPLSPQGLELNQKINIDVNLIGNERSVCLDMLEEDAVDAYEDIDFAQPTAAAITVTASCNNDDYNDHHDVDYDEATTTTATSSNVANLNAPAELPTPPPAIESQLVRIVQMESRIEALMDAYLAHIFPRYFECTRSILIRQARDLLLCSYRGCLATFEHHFLRKFTEIVTHLRQKHQIGESLLWCTGWPLVTTNGDLVLHLGALDEALVRPADIYLCVKTDTNCGEEPPTQPQLYAIWRCSTPSTSTSTVQKKDTQIKSYCIQSFACDDQQILALTEKATTTSTSLIKAPITNWLISTATAATQPHATLAAASLSASTHLSILTLEMLSDDLTQLLQNLVVGVERSIDRISLNDLQQLPKVAAKSSTSSSTSSLPTSTSTSKSTTAATLEPKLLMTNGSNNDATVSSPKCALKRSDLITKNKILGHKYMLRRLTNRQDSMNSTSSGNSCASSGSNASTNDEILSSLQTLTADAAIKLTSSNNNKNNNSESNINSNSSNSSSVIKSNSSSPALPRFCLGGSFPHIDSDEENQDEKRNSMECDQFINEIVPPTSIAEIPEKLLTSGIYLPGTRDLKGQPIITVDASLVTNAALNCYEIATVLLYYTSITERFLDFSSNQTNSAAELLKQESEKFSTQINDLAASTTTTTTTTANGTPVKSAPTTKPQTTTTTSATTAFTILITIEQTSDLNVVDVISQSLQILNRHIEFCEILAVCLDRHLFELCKSHSTAAAAIAAATTASKCPKAARTTAATITTIFNKKQTKQKANQEKIQQQQQQQQKQQQQQHQQHYTVKFISVDEVTTSVATTQLPHGKLLCGQHCHDARKWREFFMELEPFQAQCTLAGQRLVAAMCELRQADLNAAPPTRRQLYAQHRALSRALMDSELHNLRKRGVTTLAHLQQLAENIGGNVAAAATTKSTTTTTTMMTTAMVTSNNNNNNNSNNNKSSHQTPAATAAAATATMAATKSTATTTYNISFKSSKNSQNNKQQQQQQQPSALSNANSNNNKNAGNRNATTMTSCQQHDSTPLTTTTVNRLNDNYSSSNNNNNNTTTNAANTNNNNTNNNASIISNIDVAIRLEKLTLLFGEVDRAAKRLEQLTEQRRERLRELTRQHTLEEEINELTSWITNDGNETLQRFAHLQMDCAASIKAQEQEFENYYFISMKHIAKGHDLHDAAAHFETLRDNAIKLKSTIESFSEKLEQTRDRIETGSRLYQLLSLHVRDDDTQQEMKRLAEHIGMQHLLEQYQSREQQQQQQQQQQPQKMEQALESGNVGNSGRVKPNTLNLNFSRNLTKKLQKNFFASSTPVQNQTATSTMAMSMATATATTPASSTTQLSSASICHCWRESQNLENMDELMLSNADEDADDDDEEEQSKIGDSGLGGCDRCEANPKLTRICSCQSLNETTHLYDKSHNDDELDDECYEQPTKHYLKMHSPIEANAHLQCHASNLELTEIEELSCLDTKIQKTLLLIMREMIGTERDYVRSLYYVIENYVDELLRDDIPQPLRGQRNVIFGNIEKIFEFHNSHFLGELERYEHSPLKVGAAFLEMETKFSLYALYNKNKPKSDTLMSEYGTVFFKSKQIELNDKMDLASYLLKPVQRMGKYALLLQQLVKACTGPDGVIHQEIAADVEELQRAEEMVKFQLRHGNDLLAMDSLRDCDVNVKEQGRLLRQNEFLVWQGRGNRKALRHVFLFEELVLFSKTRRFPDHKNLDIYIYKNSIKTSDIGLTAHVAGSTNKFEIWFRKRKPEDTWTLQCMVPDVKNAWTEEISKLLWKQAKRNREIRLAEMSSMGIGSKPCLDIRPSNNQISDRSITISQLGKAPKLRHSFVGLQNEQNKAPRRPNSLISESSMSSGTSSSSLSTGGSSSGHEQRHVGGGGGGGGGGNGGGICHLSKQNNHHHHHHHHQGLELINETQTLMLSKQHAINHCSSSSGSGTSSNNNNSNNNNNNHQQHRSLVGGCSSGQCSNTSTMIITSSGHSHSHNHGHQHHQHQHHSRSSSCSNSHNNNNNNNNKKNNPSSSKSTSSSNKSTRNHKRSTTIISQLSMESGILSDISMTPDQELQMENATTTWCPLPAAPQTTTATKGGSSVEATTPVDGVTGAINYAVVRRMHKSQGITCKDNDSLKQQQQQQPDNTTTASSSATTITTKQSHSYLRTANSNDDASPYLKQFDETINL